MGAKLRIWINLAIIFLLFIIGGVYALFVKEPTSVSISPAVAIISTDGEITVTAKLSDALGNPLGGKAIAWSAVDGSLTPDSCVTDAKGECSVTYTAPSSEVPEGDVITASFAGDEEYSGSSGTAIITVKGKIVEEAEAKVPPIVLLTEFYPDYFVVGDDESFEIEAVVVDNTQLREVSLLYKVDNQPWREVSAEFVSGILPNHLKEAIGKYVQIPTGTQGYYKAEIPAQSAGSFVRYKFKAVDVDGNEMESTEGMYFVVDDESSTKVMVVDPSMKLWWVKENLLHFKNLTEHFASYMISSDVMENYRKLGSKLDKYSAYVVQRHHWEFLAKRYNMIVVDHEEMEDALDSFKPDVVVLSNIWLGDWDLADHGMDELVDYIRENHAGVIATHGTLYDQLVWDECSRKDAEKVGARGQVGDVPDVYIYPDEETIALTLGLYPMPLFEYLRDQAAESLCKSPETLEQAAGRTLGSTPLAVPYVPFSGSLIIEERHPIVEGLPEKFNIRIPSAYNEMGIDAYTTVGWQYVLPANITKVVQERSEIAKEKAKDFLRKVASYYEEITGNPAAYEGMLRGVEGKAGVALAQMRISPELEASFTVDKKTISLELDERVVERIIDKLPVKTVVLSDDMLAGIVVNDEWYRPDGHRSVYFSFEVEASDSEVSEKLMTNAVEWAKGWEYTLLRDLKALAREVYNMTMRSASGVISSTTVDFAIALSAMEEVPTAKSGAQILLGSAAKAKGVEFTRDTMTYEGKTYTSRWGEEDYCIIQRIDGMVNIVGTHRFGTKAGLLYYQKYSPQGTVILRWRDENGDGDVQLEEVEVVAKY